MTQSIIPVAPPIQPPTLPDWLDREGPLTTKGFFDLVLPGVGLRCIIHAHDGWNDHTFHSDNDQAAAKTAELDATGNGEVYFGCATFREPGSRKGINAHAAQSIWLDLDTAELKGPGNAPYATRHDALLEFERFCFQLALPTPLIVSSGYGFHIYWPMDAALAPDDWRETARTLKRACDKWGLKADHTRTTDIASILRVPGTHNRKNPAAPQRVKVFR